MYQSFLPTKVGTLNPSTVTFAPNSNYVTQPSNVQPFSSGGTTFYVGNPNAVEAAIYSKQLMVPYTSENKQSDPITSSGSKSITNQDLEIWNLDLSQKGPLHEYCLLSTEIPCSGLIGLVSSKAQSMQKLKVMMSNWLFSKSSFQAKRRIQLPSSLAVEYSTRTLWKLWRDNLDNHRRLWRLIPLVKRHNLVSIIIIFASCISSLVAVLKSLGYEYDLKSTSVLNQLSKMPPNMKESWPLHSLKKCWSGEAETVSTGRIHSSSKPF